MFEPNDTVLAAATEQRVGVIAEENRLVVEVSWVRLLDGAAGEAAFTAPIGRGGTP